MEPLSDRNILHIQIRVRILVSIHHNTQGIGIALDKDTRAHQRIRRGISLVEDMLQDITAIRGECRVM